LKKPIKLPKWVKMTEIRRTNANGISYHLNKTTDNSRYELQLKFDTKSQSLTEMGEVLVLTKKLEAEGKHKVEISATHTHDQNKITIRYDTSNLRGSREKRSATAVHSLLHLLEELDWSGKVAMPKVSNFKSQLYDLINTYTKREEILEKAEKKLDEEVSKPATTALITPELADVYRRGNPVQDWEFRFLKPEQHWGLTRRTLSWKDFQRKLDSGLEKLAPEDISEEEFNRQFTDFQKQMETLGSNSYYMAHMLGWIVVYSEYAERRDKAQEAGNEIEAQGQEAHLDVLSFQMEELTTAGKRYAEDKWEVKYPTDERTGEEPIRRLISNIPKTRELKK